MYKLTTSAIAAALFVCASSIAIAQTSPAGPPSAGSSNPSSPATTAPAGTTSLPAAAALTEAQVKQKLEADGYTNIHDLQRGKDGWNAKAMHNGKQVSVAVDNDGRIEAE